MVSAKLGEFRGHYTKLIDLFSFTFLGGQEKQQKNPALRCGKLPLT